MTWEVGGGVSHVAVQGESILGRGPAVEACLASTAAQSA